LTLTFPPYNTIKPANYKHLFVGKWGMNLPQFDGYLKMGTIEPQGVSDKKEEGV
jgi:hypothetical protein